MSVQFCVSCGEQLTIDSESIQKNVKCIRCMKRSRVNCNSKISSALKRIRANLDLFSDNIDSSFRLDRHLWDRLMFMFKGKCALTGRMLSNDTGSHDTRPNAIPRVIGGTIEGLKDVVLVSSTVVTRLKKQNGQKTESGDKCVIRAMSSPEVQDRIIEARRRLEEIEATQHKLASNESSTLLTISPAVAVGN